MNRSLPVLGGLPRDEAQRFPERHLGLRTADEAALPEERLDHWGAQAEAWIGLDALLEIARGAPPLPAADAAATPGAAAGAQRGRARIGVAFDEAFHFYYADNLRRLEAAGAELRAVLADPRRALARRRRALPRGRLPRGARGAPGRQRGPARRDPRVRRPRGPIYAECGGLMYLTEAIRTLDGRAHPMVGLVPAEAVMCEKLQALGYVEVETQARTILGGAGLRFRGHQFRYSELRPSPRAAPAPAEPPPAQAPTPPEHAPLPIEHAYSVRRRRGGQVAREGYRAENVLASYVHAHWASEPARPRGPRRERRRAPEGARAMSGQGRPPRRVALIGGGVRSGKSAFALSSPARSASAAPSSRRPSRSTTRCGRASTRTSASEAARSSPSRNRSRSRAHRLALRRRRHRRRLPTLWLSNLLLRDETEGRALGPIEERIEALAAAVESATPHVVLVSNEVGMGVVPESPLGRAFRDLAGRAHQRLGRSASELYVAVMGAILRLRPGPVALVGGGEDAR